MIVTADPVGDFNATSQILRYSALAREVTVPRIPSVTDIVFHGVPNPHSKSRGTTTASGRTSPDQLTSTLSFELDEAAREVGRLSDEVEILTLKLAEETVRRREAEEGWKKSEERLETLELEVREECADNMERLLDVERRRWMNALGEEKERGDEHVDRKLEVLTRGITSKSPLQIFTSSISILTKPSSRRCRCRYWRLCYGWGLRGGPRS